MRNNIIKRFAAGTLSVCFVYACIRLPLSAAKDSDEISAALWKRIEVVELAKNTADYVDEESVEIPAGRFSEEMETKKTESGEEILKEETAEQETQPEEKIYQEEPSEEEENYEVWEPEEEPQNDAPSLSEFLSTMICGGCHHNCLLVSPRCAKGRSKAENETVEYYEIYG